MVLANALSNISAPIKKTSARSQLRTAEVFNRFISNILVAAPSSLHSYTQDHQRTCSGLQLYSGRIFQDRTELFLRWIITTI